MPDKLRHKLAKLPEEGHLGGTLPSVKMRREWEHPCELWPPPVWFSLVQITQPNSGSLRLHFPIPLNRCDHVTTLPSGSETVDVTHVSSQVTTSRARVQFTHLSSRCRGDCRSSVETGTVSPSP